MYFLGGRYRVGGVEIHGCIYIYIPSKTPVLIGHNQEFASIYGKQCVTQTRILLVCSGGCVAWGFSAWPIFPTKWSKQMSNWLGVVRTSQVCIGFCSFILPSLKLLTIRLWKVGGRKMSHFLLGPKRHIFQECPCASHTCYRPLTLDGSSIHCRSNTLDSSRGKIYTWGLPNPLWIAAWGCKCFKGYLAFVPQYEYGFIYLEDHPI